MADRAARAARRAQLHAIVRYLRAVREVIERVAREHGRWVHFIAEAASLLRSPSFHSPPDRNRAHQYAVLFHQYGRFLAGQKAPPYCEPLQRAVAAWLDVLERVAIAVASAVTDRDAARLEQQVRAAAEAQIKLRTVQRVHAQTMAGVKAMFAQRPRPTPPAARRITWIS